MLFRTCSKNAAFWYFGFFGVKSIALSKNTLLATSLGVSLLIESEKTAVNLFLVLFWYKKMHFTFSQPVLGCMGLFGVHFIAIGEETTACK